MGIEPWYSATILCKVAHISHCTYALHLHTAPTHCTYTLHLHTATHDMQLQARDACDSLARALYSGIFEWLVDTLNSTTGAVDPVSHSIGILDIYGFEARPSGNSFEQVPLTACSVHFLVLSMQCVNVFVCSVQ